jgi:hypothetical protein
MKIPTEQTPKLVKVTNIGKDTKPETLRDFFTFCGKIQDFEVEADGEHQKALIMFESSKAAKTAELLSNGKSQSTPPPSSDLTLFINLM